jgi:hypothetical protein
MGQLPGGYWDADGRQHRDFELTALSGREEELLARTGQRQTATLVTEVLTRCVSRLGGFSPVPREVARGLLVADRHYLLLCLRRLTFGDLVRANLVCPWRECGERVSVEFSLADVPVEEQPERAPAFTTTLSSGVEVEFRLPTGADQEELAELVAVNEGEASTRLLARCLRRLGSSVPPTEEQVAALPAADRDELERHLERHAPRVEQAMTAACAECGRTFVTPFDIHRYLLGELRTDQDLLYQQVHYLAFHYHWSEAEIMGLTRDKRRTYIEILGDAIEELNSAG